MISEARRWIRKSLHPEQRHSRTETTGGTANKPGMSKLSAGSSEIAPPVNCSSQATPKAIHENQWTPEAHAAWIARMRAAADPRLLYLTVLGPAGVGKSSLYKKIMYDDLTGGSKLLHDEFDPTLEDRSYATYSCGDSQYQIYFRFSTAGHAAGIDCYCSYYSYCGIILVYDLSSPHTWVEAVRLQKLIGGCHPLAKGENESQPKIKVMLLGLKADIPGGLYVPHAEREAFARKNGPLFAECSARTGEWVHEAIGLFVEHAHGVISRHPELSCPGVVNTSQRQLFDSLDEALTAVRKNAVSPRLPEVYRHWRWQLIRYGTLTRKDVDHRGGSMCVAIWGHPSIGKSFLLDMV
ncbi:P-loop containing nucleoside triphosphate hydrolase protein [Coniochaeta sp. 2T2.1]|nr:P-loop containing nucleoside triphosphate hydrolase protein [Coniochaeta sp. 2T2.1]